RGRGLARVQGGSDQRHRARRAQRAHPQGCRGVGRVDAPPTAGAGGAPGAQGEARTEAPMKRIDGVALRAEGGRFEILDQTRLPHEEVWLDGTRPGEMVPHLRRLSVRGAPLIGVAAALSIGAAAERGIGAESLRSAMALLREARPTAANLGWAMDRLRAVLDGGGSASDLLLEAEAIYDEDVAACLRMGDLGADLIQRGEQVLAHCNA